MHHRSTISSAYDLKFRECDKNVLLDGIPLTSSIAMLHNYRFVFDTKSTRTELIECIFFVCFLNKLVY